MREPHCSQKLFVCSGCAPQTCSHPESWDRQEQGTGQREGLWTTSQLLPQQLCVNDNSCCITGDRRKAALGEWTLREVKGTVSTPSKGTVCGQEAAGPWPGPTLTEGSEIPERPALTSFESLTFIFKGSFPETLCDSSLPEGLAVTTSVLKPLFSCWAIPPRPSACHSGSQRRDSFSKLLGFKAETLRATSNPVPPPQ